MEDLIFFEWVLWGTAAEGRPVKPVADLLSLEQWLRKPGQCLLGAKFLLTIMAAVPCLLLPPTPALQSAQVGGCLCSCEERTGFSSAHFTGGCCSVTRLCLTLCNGMDCSISSFPVLHYLLEFARIHVHLSVMLSNHLILCHPLLLLPSIFPSIRIFSNELALRIRWPKDWSFSISPSSKFLLWTNPLKEQGASTMLLRLRRPSRWLNTPIRQQRFRNKSKNLELEWSLKP